MPLSRDRLAHVRPLADGGFTAQCPVCHQAGGDGRGVHLRVFPSGAFACVAHPGDRHHRSLVWAIAGERAVGDYRAPGVVRVEQRPASRRRRVSLIEDVELLCPQILAHPWDPADMPADSPAPIPKALADQSAGLLRLFRPRDTVWIGHLCDSGRPWHRDHFRTAEEWLAADRLPPGPRICTSSFKPGEYRRTQSYVRARRFLVVESDGLDLPSQGAILRWLSKAGLKLRAIVHSGGRSLHGWFDFPCATDLVDLRLLLPALGCDPALFSAVQPVRLPGWRRPDLGTIPRLLYLSP